MNYIQFIEGHLISLTNGCEYTFRPVIDETLDKYKKSDYLDLFDLLREAELKIKQMRILSERCTVNEFAGYTGVSIGTARKQLKSLEFASCDKENRPYIYGLIDGKA